MTSEEQKIFVDALRECLGLGPLTGEPRLNDEDRFPKYLRAGQWSVAPNSLGEGCYRSPQRRF